MSKAGQLSVVDDILVFDCFDSKRCNSLFVVPVKVSQVIVSRFHSSVCGGHMGINATLSKLQFRFWWPNMQRDVTEVVRNCLVCQQMKPSRHPCSGPLHPITSGFPFQTLHIDIAGPLNVTSTGEQYILIMVDSFTNSYLYPS